MTNANQLIFMPTFMRQMLSPQQLSCLMPATPELSKRTPVLREAETVNLIPEDTMKSRCVVLLCVACLNGVLGHADHRHEGRAEELKNKWGVQSVIRDMDHIKEDVQAMMELTEVGELSQNQMIFYLIRMHDFDDNGGLDGIELRTALSHSMEHMEEIDQRSIALEGLIDEILRYDDSGDGFVDYGEFRRHATP